MNWGKAAKYAAALFVAQVAIGFLEGFFSPSHASIGSAVASFVVCGAIFVHLSIHQSSKPFAHAWLALFLQVAVALLIAQVLTDWIGSIPPPLIALEWVVLICALIAGTALGSNLRHRTGQPADA